MHLLKRWMVIGLALGFAVLACNYPGLRPSVPSEIPAPDLTLTAVFSLPQQTLPAENPATPVQPGLQTPLPGPTVQASPIAPTKPAGELARSGPNVSAVKLEKPPVIDGSLDDWKTAKNDVSSVVYGANNWTGKNDLSGWFMMGWDDSYLYLGAQVIDDHYVQNETGAKLYRGDSLELLFDSNLAGDFYVASMSPDDFQLGISPGKGVPGQNGEAYLWSPSDVAGPRPQVIFASTATDNGYQIEAAIPWHVFETKPAAGNRYGFVFSISDNDNPSQNIQETMISNDPNRALTDPTTWGNLMLTEP